MCGVVIPNDGLVSPLDLILPGAQYVFMDMSSYEETRVKKDESWAKYLKEGMEVLNC